MKKTATLILLLLSLSLWVRAQTVDRELVLVEIGTGTWCPYCPGSAMAADELIENGHDVAIIEYHSGDDYQNTYSLSRVSYYNITGFPTALFDGGNPYVGGSSTQSLYGAYLPRVNARLGVASNFTITADGTTSGLTDFDVNVTVEKTGNPSTDNLVLHAAVTESHIEESWQGMSELNFVCRLMIPNQYGTSLDFSSGNTQQFNLQFSLDDEWAGENCEVVFFVQNSATKEVQQTIKMLLTEFPSSNTEDVSVNEITNLPDKTCSGEFEPMVNIRNYGSADLTSLSIHYAVNGEEESVYEWSGSLEYLAAESIQLPAISFGVIEENELLVYSSDPNGNPDLFPSNDTSSMLTEQAVNTPLTVSLIIRTDSNPGETTWEILDPEGVVVYSGGPYTISGEMINESFDLGAPGCYEFNIYDAGGDGFLQPGFFMLYHGSSTSILQGTHFGSHDFIEFDADDGVGIKDREARSALRIYPNPFSGNANLELTLNAPDPVRITIYNLTGRMVSLADHGIMTAGTHNIVIEGAELPAGVYFVQVTAGKAVYSEKVTIR